MTDEEKENARKLFAQQCDFVLAAAEPEQFPKSNLPEIAFIGRSNVGKSSLINALTNRKSLARASNTPGRTQQIVFFNLANRLMVADLPGYGHADAPRAEKDRWNQLVHSYLQSRPPLRCTCLLIDSRHGVMANDLSMMQFLDRAAASYQVVLTKLDQLRGVDRKERLKAVEEKIAKHPAARPGALMTSSEKQDGIADLRAFLAAFAEPAQN
ncbi:MAG TPA: ribosome biogenesis GTP-binding protein YihA/YsxC [Alphaproteobacteria bacterium]|nr:ribosome biogenesis GTP-binding protein YihA/YsxC [Alphaproteobacteria bacterium]